MNKKTATLEKLLARKEDELKRVIARKSFYKMGLMRFEREELQILGEITQLHVRLSESGDGD